MIIFLIKVEKTTTTKSTEKKVEKIDVDVLSLSKKEQEKLLNDLHPEIQHLKSDLPVRNLCLSHICGLITFL